MPKADLLPALQQTPPWGVLLWVPDLATLGLVASLRLLAPAVRLLVALPPDPATCQEAEDLDVAGLLSAAHLAQELSPCLEKVEQGRRFLSQHLPLAHPAATAPAGFDPGGLCPREREVLRLLARGETNSHAIGDLLHLSPRTVDTHKDHLQEKLGLTCRAKLYWFAGQHQAAILALAPS
jgi:DNA-binding NarL/FixJ family response regulator